MVDLGVLHPGPFSTERLQSGQIGYVTLGDRDLRNFRVGETIWADGAEKTGVPFPGFRPAQPMVYAGIYPEAVGDSEKLESAMQRLLLTDASVESRRDISPVLGAGYRCGFLGLLHLDVFRQRLSTEHGVPALATSPTVPYRLTMANGNVITAEYSGDFPTSPAPPPKLVEEPIVAATIVLPRDHVPLVTNLCKERRGSDIMAEPLDTVGSRIMLRAKLPLAEVITDFFDRLQAASHGFATFDYQPVGYAEVDLVKVSVKLNDKLVEALSFFAIRNRAMEVSKKVLDKLAELIPQQQFEIILHACVGGKVITKARIKALRKDVIAQKITSHGCSGDPERRKKLLDRQKEGKKRLREIGKVQVPPEAFLAMVKI